MIPASICAYGPPQDDGSGLAGLLLGSLLFLLAWLAVYKLWSRPLRQHIRGRCLLDVLRFGLRNGTPLEAILSARGAAASLGHRGFRRAARCLNKGGDIQTAVGKLGAAIPEQFRALLLGGIRTGNLEQALPVADRTFARQTSRTEAFGHYLFLLVFYWFVLVVVSGANAVLLPRIATLLGQMSGGNASSGILASPAYRAALAGARLTGLIQAVLLALAVAYGLGRAGLPRPLRLPMDALATAILPWQRLRCRHDFALMLATSLDAGVPESEAVQTAANATGNRWFQRRCKPMVQQLATGESLALLCTRFADPSGQLAWRLRSSQNTRAVPAVDEWCRHLAARAYRDEQAAAQFFSTLLLLLLAACVAMLAWSILAPLTELVRRATLW